MSEEATRSRAGRTLLVGALLAGAITGLAIVALAYGGRRPARRAGGRKKSVQRSQTDAAAQPGTPTARPKRQRRAAVPAGRARRRPRRRPE